MVFDKKAYMKIYNKGYKKKPKHKVKMKEYYKKHKETILEYGKKWKIDNEERVKIQNRIWLENNRTRHNKNIKEWDKKHPKIKKAHNKSRYIKIPKGKMCEECGKRLAVEKHHKDYDKPLEVVFLCLECHKKKYKRGG